MASTIRRVRRSVQKIATAAGLAPAEAELAGDVVLGISKSSSCHLSQIARALNERCRLIQTERRLSEGLSNPRSELEAMRLSYLDEVADTAAEMPFIIGDTTDLCKPYGQAFEHLDTIRDASDPRKKLDPGYWCARIEAFDEAHGSLPLCSEVYSTQDPDYRGWYQTHWQGVHEVAARLGSNGIWLWDRGFDCNEHYRELDRLQLRWVVRQLQTRNVRLANGTCCLMSEFAAGLNKPHHTTIPYVCKKTHQLREYPVRFGYAPVELPELDGQFYLLVITGTRGGDIVLLTRERITGPRQAARIVRAYIHRWGCEEGIRFWKQKTHVEDFRVRSWNSIRRLTFLSMLATGIQALWLLKRPAVAQRFIARVKVFIEHVPFRHYRLWDGVADALLAEA